MTFADNHDVTRLASILTNKRHIPLAYELLFGMPDIPCIYYGSEWGEEGTKSPDNDYALRPCFDAPKPNDLTDLIRRLIALRRESDALCSGSYRNIVITNHQLIFERKTEKEQFLVAVNASDCEFTAGHHELNGTYEQILSFENETITSGKDTSVQELNGQLVLPAYSIRYLKRAL